MKRVISFIIVVASMCYADPKLKLFDQFNGPTGELLQNHQMAMGAGYRQLYPFHDMQIDHGAIEAVSGASNPVYVSDAGISIGTMRLKLNVDLTDSQVVLHLAGDQDAHYEYMIICYPKDNLIQVFLRTPFVVLQTLPYTFAAGEQTWGVILLEDSLMLTINNTVVTVISIPTPPTYTWFGFELYHPYAQPGTKLMQLKVQ